MNNLEEISKLETGVVRIGEIREQLFGNPEDIVLSTIPVETLLSMEWWIDAQLDYLGNLLVLAENDWENGKTARDEAINERAIEYLKTVVGQGKVSIAEKYAKNDCKEQIRGVNALHLRYKKLQSAAKNLEGLKRTISQTVSTVNKEMERQQFIKGR